MAATTDPLHDTILDLEDQTWKALQRTGAALIPFLSKDCQMLFPMGVRVTATSTPNLKEVMTSEAFVPWVSYDMHEVLVTELGPDTALITYKVQALRPQVGAPDDGQPFKALIASVWRRSPGADWLMVLHQQTPYSELVEE
ncbi:uncharacterized protein HMPREF1541_01586 [Cyphellophora europaea CBS 101466]|uniref:DUF4440 domain-containing protein n=1 Tax=Cyphellophora europaea (strain CBS 101466) TaxID=1220924 RepID=W2S154_CYPE1|nr:uncharacterized protein HMPREF1541_01586 [Cyphellophora europaea CBS 101466]ETN42431.1 hypothetical protein HMPREF1541_01586 [Cyphellophora europaea CBS 101466]